MTEVYVSVERRYKLYEGKYYVQGIENVSFFERYLQCFDKVNVIARTEKVEVKPENHEIFEHDLIRIQPIFTTGTGLASYAQLIKTVNVAEKSRSLIIIRTPGVLAYLLSIILTIKKMKFSLEVVTNPRQEAKNLSANKIVRTILSFIFIEIFKLQLRKANFVSFVTRFEIQDEFLTKAQSLLPRYNSSYSSVVLHEQSYAANEVILNRISRNANEKIKRLLFIGVLDRDFKGLDVFLNMLAALPENYVATVIGDGFLLPTYKSLAHELGISERVVFCGYVSSTAEKNSLMAQADYFVLTSRREGLPRVVIEAMAAGLPCICSRVSGVKELVDEKFIFDVNDFLQARDIITKIDEKEFSDICYRNFHHAQQYNHKLLNAKRKSFYLKVISSENTTFK